MTMRAQESVWDYPRPPRLEATDRHIRLVKAGRVVADTQRALRILETSHPPVYYMPQADIRMELLRGSARRGSFCEWKGVAQYWDLLGDAPIVGVAWSYARPTARYAALQDALAFYPGQFQGVGDECSVDGEAVVAQPGDFYGGWITRELVGPFKGAPGTLGW